MVVLHDSGLYIRTVFITKCGTDIGCSCQHFLCMCKLPDGVVILVCIRVSDSLDGGKHANRGCVQEFNVCILIIKGFHKCLADFGMLGSLPHNHRRVCGHDSLVRVIRVDFWNRIAVHILEQVR